MTSATHAPGEFELIARYFTRASAANTDVVVGIGDDCALLDVGPGPLLAVTADLLVEKVHFLPGVDPESLGHKALAVNLSDLAACGATPRWFFLSIALPAVDETWLAAFTRGLLALADRHSCALAGGDTTRSASGVTINITALGSVGRGEQLLRSGACAGDDLWVSGELGDAALALARQRGEVELAAHAALVVGERLLRPQPRVALGKRLRGVATSAIDVSDGLLGDLRHVLERSGVGARVDWPAVPRSSVLRQQPQALQWRCALAGGDDYELLFTAPAARRAEVEHCARGADVAVSRIGAIQTAGGLAVVDADGRAVDTGLDGFEHFRSQP